MIDQYIDELELELRRAAGRRVRLGAARVPRVPASPGGVVAGVCAVAACLAVVVALLQVAPARRAAGGSGSATRTGPTAPAVVPAGARAVVSELAVMRRPQTAADRITARVPPLIVIGSMASPRSPGPTRLTVVPSLTRLVARMPHGRRLYLAIGRAGSEYVVVWLETPFTYHPVSSTERHRLKLSGPQGLLASPALTAAALRVPRDAAVPEGIPDDPAQPVAGPKTWVEIVPDTVARARWTIQYPGRRQRVKKTFPISNNVALLRVPEGQLDEVWAINWLAPNGHVLATLTYRTAFQ